MSLSTGKEVFTCDKSLPDEIDLKKNVHARAYACASRFWHLGQLMHWLLTTVLQRHFSWGHKVLNHFVCHLGPSVLVFLDDRLQDLCTVLLHLSGQQFAASVILGEAFEQLVVLAEEAHVPVSNVHLHNAALFPVLLKGGATAGECILVDLLLDLFRRVRDENCAVLIGGAHLGVVALKSWKELGVDEGWLLQLEAVCCIPRHPKVRVLVNGARDEAGIVGPLPENVWERRGERWCRLDGRKAKLADVVAVREAKNCLYLVTGGGLLNANDVGPHPAYVVRVCKDKRLVGVETAGDDVPGVVAAHLLVVLQLLFLVL
mmetsp:Transcript_928/g.2925  ORF Transcript_928/g.2925 Transcript_928/m.2925 type:complete len:317 (-) Transcript_928:770-1720(-)